MSSEQPSSAGVFQFRSLPSARELPARLKKVSAHRGSTGAQKALDIKLVRVQTKRHDWPYNFLYTFMWPSHAHNDVIWHGCSLTNSCTVAVVSRCRRHSHLQNATTTDRLTSSLCWTPVPAYRCQSSTEPNASSSACSASSTSGSTAMKPG